MEEISRKKEVDEMKMLSKIFDPITIDFDSTPPGTWGIIGATNQDARIILQAVNYCVVAQSTYFDLAGMKIDDETLFIKLAQVQRYFPPTLSNAATGDAFDEMMIMSVHPLSDADLIRAASDIYSVLAFDEIVYASCRRYVKTVDEGNFGSPVLLHDNITSGAEATASDRIYCYRLSSPTAVTPLSGVDRATLLSVNFVIVADAKKEADYEYLMRLARSYQLQNEPDRD
jgi:hypothetical protein